MGLKARPMALALTENRHGGHS